MQHHTSLCPPLIVALGLIAGGQPLASAEQAARMCFPETGYCIEGRFVDYWLQHGGLGVFGFPITPAHQERNPDTGRTYRTQWFERARFEWRPENRAPYDVLLGRLGNDQLRRQGVDWRTLPRAAAARPGCLWFEETGHNVCDQAPGLGFRSYWEAHGLADPSLPAYGRSLALLGLPLSEPREETNPNGDRVLTQWFERARLEWHPDQPDEYKVLLGLLGAEVSEVGVTLIAAGDIAGCDTPGDEATAALLDALPGTVAALGDNVYEDGTRQQFADCYDPTWGRHKARTRPAVGNHEYRDPGAAGYFAYFGSAAGEPGKGYYSYDLAAWHVIVLNSNCAEVGGCHAGSPQERWLRADLAGRRPACLLAYWHHPLFSSGGQGNTTAVRPLWQALYDHRADVIVNGHDHNYERFAPQDPSGRLDPGRGIREFVVGTGGRGALPLGQRQPNSEALDNATLGLLKLTLRPDGYLWQFIPVSGQTFADAGRGACHRPE